MKRLITSIVIGLMLASANISNAAVVIQNYGLGAAKQLGMTPETFRKIDALVKNKFSIKEIGDEWSVRDTGFTKRYAGKTYFSQSINVWITWDGKIMVDGNHVGDWDKLK